MRGRDLDLVLLGASGFVGRLTAAHLAAAAPAGLRVGLAGRSPERLAGTRAGLGPAAAGWPLLPVDVTDEVGLRALARRTRVLVSTVGPYLRHGLPVVSACAGAGTAYADLTGETLFVRRSIDTCHDRAVDSGARLVHSCGFDSVPSDLGVGLAAAQAEADGTGPLAEAVLRVRSARGGVSGGTVDSLRQQLVEVRGDPALRALVTSSVALTSRRSAGGRSPGHRPPVVSREAATGHWQAPWVMGAYNAQVVQRTNALSGWAYGTGFAYREVVDTGPGPRGAVVAAGITAGTAALVAGLALGPSRAVLDRVLPAPGEGPDERARARGRFRVEVEARTVGGARYAAVVAAPYDPGYGGTAVMLGESGLALALDGSLPERGGVLTPMAALGATLPDRLRAHRFEVAVRRLDEAPA